MRDARRDTAWPRRRPLPPWRRSWPPRRGCRRRPGRPWRRPRAGPALQPGPGPRPASPRCFRPRSCDPRTTLSNQILTSQTGQYKDCTLLLKAMALALNPLVITPPAYTGQGQVKVMGVCPHQGLGGGQRLLQVGQHQGQGDVGLPALHRLCIVT